MKPYYDDGCVTIYHGDCREILPSLSGIGLVLTSPPYNIGGVSGSMWSRLKDGYASHSDTMPHSEYVEWQRGIIQGCWNALDDDGAIFYQHKPITRGNQVRLPFELVPPGLPLRQIITWDRGCGFQRAYWHFVPRYEWILVVARENFRVSRLDVFDVWAISPAKHEGHPAPFPLKLASTAIGATSAETVLDPFMGSGTTLRAAKDHGRRAVGIEIEERYCEIAAKRCAQDVLDLEAA